MPIHLPAGTAFAVTNTEFAMREAAITQWQRLEPEVAALDLAPGLEARIADPLWLVGRQWQLAELRGEDCGSPIRVEAEGEKLQLQFRADSSRAGEPLAKSDGLVEPVVEAEAALAGLHALAAQAGLDFERALDLHGAKSLVHAFRAEFPFAAPPAFDGPIIPQYSPVTTPNSPNGPTSMASITDGTSNTFLVGETDFKPQGVPSTSMGSVASSGPTTNATR